MSVCIRVGTVTIKYYSAVTVTLRDRDRDTLRPKICGESLLSYRNIPSGGCGGAL
jgi:hypothetical protein